MIVKTLEVRSLLELKPHPWNAEIYGSVADEFSQELLDSLSKDGVWPGEIQILPSGWIISGHRRHCHVTTYFNEETHGSDWHLAQVWVRDDLPDNPDSQEVREAMLQANLQREKTEEQTIREFAAWQQILNPSGKSGPKRANDDTAYHDSSQCLSGPTRDIAAAKVGEKRGCQLEKLAKALAKADELKQAGDEEGLEIAKNFVRTLNSKSRTAAIAHAKAAGLIEEKPSRTSKTQRKQKKEALPKKVLPDLAQSWISREKRASAARAVLINSLEAFNADMEKLWKAAQRNFEKDGRSVLREFFAMADQELTASGALAKQCEALGLPPDSTYLDILRGIDAKAKKLSRAARSAIYLFGYTETIEE